MFRKILSFIFVSVIILSSSLSSIEYEIQDIGILQTHSSQPIAINNSGQILGWYNLDGKSEGKHYFIREKNGCMHELPKTEKNYGLQIDWKYLVDNGKVYGTFDGNHNFSVLYEWDPTNGVVKLGNLPGKEISAINNAGQVLLSSIDGTDQNGKPIKQPAIWHYGKVSKLKGLEGNVGIESSESYGLDMNNNGVVVGRSVVDINYKNTLYKQTHAVKWVNGQAIDLHRELPKSQTSIATVINDLGDIVVGSYLIRADGKLINSCWYFALATSSNSNCFFNAYDYNRCRCIMDRNGNVDLLYGIKGFEDYDCIWMGLDALVDMNDEGEVIGIGTTIYGEQHAILLTPIQEHSNQ